MLVTQWNNNKVVSCTSTLGVLKLDEVCQRKGSDVLVLVVERALHEYQEFMDGVKHSNQMKACGEGFADKAHLKK